MHKGERGQALVLVILMTAVIFTVGTAALALGSTAHRIAVLEVAQKRAYYIAEAGVEKVLAKAKSDPDWVKGLPLDAESDFLHHDLGGNGSYAGGEFKQIIVKKTADTVTSATLEVTSTGEYRKARRTVQARAEINFVYSENIFRGLWTSSLTGVKLAHGADIASNVVASDGEIKLPAGSIVKGHIYSKTKVTLEDKHGGDPGVRLEGDVYCAGGGVAPGQESVYLGENSSVQNVYVEAGRVNIQENVTVAGKIYVRSGDQLDQNWRNANPEKWEVVPALDVTSLIPQYPNILTDENLSWYKENADHYYQGNITFDSGDLGNLQGLYYIEGNATFSGEYSGRATFVVNGNVKFEKYSGRDKASLVRRTPSQDVINILCTGDVDTQNANGRIEALIYSRDGSALIKNKTDIVGSVVFRDVATKGCEIELDYDPQMVAQYEQHLNWTTSFVRATKWQEL